MADSPNVDNYYIGKGVISFAPQGMISGDWRDVGNVPVFEFQAKPTKLDHFSSRHGIRTKDRSVITTQEATLTITLEEWTRDNLAVALMGDALSGEDAIAIFSKAQIVRAVKFVGSNAVGPQVTIVLPIVSLTPSKGIPLIGETWGQFELTGDVLVDQDGSFGSFVWSAQQGDV